MNAIESETRPASYKSTSVKRIIRQTVWSLLNDLPPTTNMSDISSIRHFITYGTDVGQG